MTSKKENSEEFIDNSQAKALFSVDEHEEVVIEEGQPIRRKGIYLLPNMLTTGNLFCGFYSIISAQSGFFNTACIAIFIAMILDTLDGRVARITNTVSKFGEQYDSLADMLTFGIAPALLSYFWSLEVLGKLGWTIAFIYTGCTALRLARFNSQTASGNSSSKYFIGLPSPSAAGIIASLVWLLYDLEVQNLYFVNWVVAFVTALASILMVSNISYSSFKNIDFKGRVHFVFGICIVLSFVIIFADPPKVLFTIFAVYSISGIILSIKNKAKPT